MSYCQVGETPYFDDREGYGRIVQKMNEKKDRLLTKAEEQLSGLVQLE